MSPIEPVVSLNSRGHCRERLEVKHFSNESAILVSNICDVAVCFILSNIIENRLKGKGISHLIEKESEEVISNS
jgi:hypothetical protein